MEIEIEAELGKLRLHSGHQVELGLKLSMPMIYGYKDNEKDGSLHKDIMCIVVQNHIPELFLKFSYKQKSET